MKKMHVSLKYVRSLVLYLLLLGVIGVLMAGESKAELIQQTTVRGEVIDAETGEPLPGVSIVLQGTTTGTTTNMEGEFELPVPSLQETLVFSYVGFEGTEVSLDGMSEISVELYPRVISGEELIVTGYSVQQRRDITGSISIVDMDNYATSTSSQIGSRLQGRASGVSVVTSGQPGAGPDVRIRGINTFGNNAPLYVVDGVPTTNINNLNPDDVESMQVLKDASAASIYGARAANGVIIVTTRQGEGAMSVNYRTYSGYERPRSGNVWNILNPMEQAELKWMANENSGLDPRPDPLYGDGATPRLPDYLQPTGAMEGDVDYDTYHVVPEYTGGASQLNEFVRIVPANHEGTIWWDEIMRNAFITNHDLSVNSGTEWGNYMVSLNYRSQEGTQYNTNQDRVTLRVNTRFNVNDNIRIGENLSYSTWSGLSGNAIGATRTAQPIIPVYDIKGNLAGNYGTGLGGAANPTAGAHHRRNNTNQNHRLFGNTYAEVDFLEHFTARTNFGVDFNYASSAWIQYPGYFEAEPNSAHAYNESSSWGGSYTWSNTVNYLQHFDNHRVEVLGGTETFMNRNGWMNAQARDYFDLHPDYLTLGTGGGQHTNNSGRNATSLLSVYGKLDYAYDDRYIFSFTLRRDGSSKLPVHTWGTFPAASIGWRISRESFMQGFDWISDLRLSASYGVMGNERNVPADNAFSTYQASFFSAAYAVDGEENYSGFQQARRGNPYATWEKNITSNIGIDAILFSDRIVLALEYYNKSVEDLLFNPQRPASQGTAAVPYINVASMSNTGIDASVQSYINFGFATRLDATMTFTSYNNTIDKVSNLSDWFSQTSMRFQSDIVRNEVGHPVSSFYGYQIVGFWNSQEEIDEANAMSPDGTYQQDAAPGRFRYADVTGDNQVTPDDRTHIGNPNPDFTTGLDLRLAHRNFDMSAFFYASVGNDIWNQNKWWTDMYQSLTGAKSHTALYDSWTPENQNATAPIQETQSTISTSAVPNSYYVEDGSFLKLKSLMVGYSLPVDIIQTFGFSRFRVYAQAENLFTITGYSALDPEVPGGGTSFGIDDGFYLAQRQYMLGLELSF